MHKYTECVHVTFAIGELVDKSWQCVPLPLMHVTYIIIHEFAIGELVDKSWQCVPLPLMHVTYIIIHECKYQ